MMGREGDVCKRKGLREVLGRSHVPDKRLEIKRVRWNVSRSLRVLHSQEQNVPLQMSVL